MTRRSGPKAASPRTPAKESDTPQGSTRPPLGPTTEAHALALAGGHAAIAAVGRAQRAVRLLEVVAAGPRCPAIRAPRHLADQLSALADELDEERAA